MNPLETLRAALMALRNHKLRSALTAVGIIIGTSATIAMLAVGAGARAQVAAQVQSLGSNLLIIVSGNINQAGVRLGAGATPTLTDRTRNLQLLKERSWFDVPLVAPISAAPSSQLKRENQAIRYLGPPLTHGSPTPAGSSTPAPAGSSRSAVSKAKAKPAPVSISPATRPAACSTRPMRSPSRSLPRTFASCSVPASPASSGTRPRRSAGH